VRVLVIEDDRRLARLIEQVLTKEGLDVDLAHDGETGLELAQRGAAQVAVVDWMLPGRDGPSICRALRAARIPIAILLLTARGQIEDRVAGLDSGADDYLVKPFAFDELLARVRALSRRFGGDGADVWELRLGEIVLDQRARVARRGDKTLDLTTTEWKMLECFLRHPDQTLTRESILDYVWSYKAEVQPSLVDVYVSYLRRKLNRPGAADPIQTVRGVGYRLERERA
jgi:DNA-binding response OmpR family regulator